MQNINKSTTYYIVSNAFPDGYIAAITSGSEINSLTLAGPGLQGVSQQLHWKFTAARNASEWNICTNDLYTNTYCLDQGGNNASQPALQASAYVLGQQWILTRQQNQSSGATLWRFISDFAGPSAYLAASGIGLQSLALENGTERQHALWQLVDANAASTATSTTATLTGTTASTSAATTTSAPTPYTSNSGTGGLSTGAKVGIAIGSVAAAIILLVILVLLFRRNRRKSPRGGEPATFAGSGQYEPVTTTYSRRTYAHEMSDNGAPEPRELGHAYGYGQAVHEPHSGQVHEKDANERLNEVHLELE